MSTADAKNSIYTDSLTLYNHEERRRVRKKSRKDGHSLSYYGSGKAGYSDDKPAKKIDWQYLLPYFKRIRPKPSLDFFSQNIEFSDLKIHDPLWLESESEYVTNQQLLQIVSYLQNKCSIPPLELIRPDKHHETFISTIKEEVMNASIDDNNIKVLINFGYNSAWVIFQRVPPQYNLVDDTGDVIDLRIQSYINLSSSEYHCLNKLFPYVLKRNVLPDTEVNPTDVDVHNVSIIGNIEELEPPDESNYKNIVQLGGSNWNVVPPIFDVPSHNFSASKILRNLLYRYGYDEFEIRTDEVLPEFEEANSFIERQYISCIYDLMSIESELHLIKETLLSELAKEHAYPHNIKHEPVVAKYITYKAKSAQRCSQFRRIMSESIEHFAKEFSKPPEKGESEVKSEEKDPSVKSESNQQDDVNVKQISYYYCSVCLLPEQAHKNVLLQCKRCRMRVHFKCYADIDSTLTNPDGSEWLCDACQIECSYGSKDLFVPNRAICIICGSSGGAMKSVDGDTAIYYAQTFSSQMNIQNNRNAEANPPVSSACSWIHIICGAWLIPFVNCKNWINLSHWDLSALKAIVKPNRCSICMTSIGFYVSCIFPDCASKMHPMCAWLSGCYASSTIIYSKSLPFNNSPDDCFTPLRIDPLCLFHTNEQFSQDIIRIQSKRRCTAYLDYVFNPNAFNKGRQINKSLSLWPSPVMITLNGPISSFGLPFPALTSSIYPNGQMFPTAFDHSTSYSDFLLSQQGILYPKQDAIVNTNHTMPVQISHELQEPENAPIALSRYKVALDHLEGLNPGLCSICYMVYDSPTMEIIQCESCKVLLHPQCYFIFDTRVCDQDQVEYTTPFLCYKCLCIRHESKCIVCGYAGGAMVYVTSSFPKVETNRSKRSNPKFAHPLCGLFAHMPVSFHKETNSQFFKSRETLAIFEAGTTCYICMSSEGFTEKCNESTCDKRFHVYCAKRCGFYVHLESGGINSYCLTHSLTQATASPRLDLYLKLLTIVDIANISLLN